MCSKRDTTAVIWKRATAEALVAEMNAREDDKWSYAVELITPDTCKIAAFDEDGEFAGYF